MNERQKLSKIIENSSKSTQKIMIWDDFLCLEREIMEVLRVFFKYFCEMLSDLRRAGVD